MNELFARVAERTSDIAGRPSAFIAALVSVLLWAVIGPVFHFSDVWQLTINTGTTIITFLLIFLLQNATNVQTRLMQDELKQILLEVHAKLHEE
jgi:low affinity Fe/Cu permease